MPDKKTISETLYLGLLFAEQDAGGTLIPGMWARTVQYGPSDIRRGLAPCGCIHGAAMFYAGYDVAGATSQLDRIGLTEPAFDGWARKARRAGVPLTVDACLLHFGVDVVPDAELVGER